MRLDSRFIDNQIIKLLNTIEINKNIIEEINCINDFQEASFKLCLNGSIRIRFIKNIIFNNEYNSIELFLSQFIGYPLIIKINNIYLISKIYSYKIIANYVHFYISIANSEELNKMNINLQESNIIDIDNIYILTDSIMEQYEIIVNESFGGSIEYQDKEIVNKIWGKGSSYIIGCVFKSIVNDIIVEDTEDNISPSINIKNGNNYLLRDNFRTNEYNNENIKISYIQNYINSNNDFIIKIINYGTSLCNSLICNISIVNKYKIDNIIKFLRK